MSWHCSFTVDFCVASSNLHISGDFNIHVDEPSSCVVSPFLNLLDSLSLSQLVSIPTHSANHILDLIITRSDSSIITNCSVNDPGISDHLAVSYQVSFLSPLRPAPVIKQFRNLKKFNVVNFSCDVLASELYCNPPSSLSHYYSLFKSTLSTLVDKYVPLKTFKSSSKINKPFYTPEIHKAKSLHSKLETIYRRTRSATDFHNFKNQAKIVSKLVTNARRYYFRKMITDNKSCPRKLWLSLNSLLNRTTTHSLPSTSSETLDSEFITFFSDKMFKLNASLPSLSTSHHKSVGHTTSTPLTLSEFTAASETEMQTAILNASDTSCSLDYVPTKILKSCLDVLLTPITTLINLCLAESTLPADFKHAVITPLLKKTHCQKTFHPVTGPYLT